MIQYMILGLYNCVTANVRPQMGEKNISPDIHTQLPVYVLRIPTTCYIRSPNRQKCEAVYVNLYLLSANVTSVNVTRITKKGFKPPHLTPVLPDNARMKLHARG